ncbi:flavoprotein [Nonomuraea typhae]|uniref:Flavoprotein n=1 Tax=Nonomuraea typhae TaxID=2603600 RepID=A0ABW7Z932_9ACTN
MSDPARRLLFLPPPGFEVGKLLYVGTGCLCVAFMPYWLNWLRRACPGTEVLPIITRNAERFVTRGALAALSGREVALDVWAGHPEPQAAPHVNLAQWPEAIVVHPASMHFVSRLALGIADTPVLLALQCTGAPIVVAPALPPGALTSAAYRRHRDALAERGNVVVVPPIPGSSVTGTACDAAVAAPLPEALATLGPAHPDPGEPATTWAP